MVYGRDPTIVQKNEQLLHDLGQVLQGPFSDVDPAFELVHETAQEPLIEVIVGESKNRFIVAPQLGKTALVHARLSSAGLPLFSDLHNSKLLMLSIPPGARPLGSMMAAVGRDPKRGAQLFSEAGKVVGDILSRGMGLPGASLLNQFAVVNDGIAPSGVAIRMVPPYEFDPEQTLGGFLNASYAELDLYGLKSRLIEDLVSNLAQGIDQHV